MAPAANAMPSKDTNVQPVVPISDSIIAASVRPARRQVTSAAWLLMSSRSYQRRKPSLRMLEVGIHDPGRPRLGVRSAPAWSAW